MTETEPTHKEPRPNTWFDCLAENDRLRAQVAGLDLEIARRTKRLTGELEEAVSERDHFLSEITDLHREYVEKDCDGCDGKGFIVEMVHANYPSRHDPMTPAEVPAESVCEDCLGTGKEWGV